MSPVMPVTDTRIPRCEKGIGDVILSPTSPRLIEGVKIAPLAIWPDDRGYFMEVQRIGRGLAEDFPPATTQISAARNYPGIIKAFHIHKYQTDCWTPAVGMLQVALADLRPDSRTFGWRNTIYVGHFRPWQILIRLASRMVIKLLEKKRPCSCMPRIVFTTPPTKAGLRITTRT